MHARVIHFNGFAMESVVCLILRPIFVQVISTNIPSSVLMGDPKKGTRAYVDKLRATKLAKAVRRKIALRSKPVVRQIVSETLQRERSKWLGLMKQARDENDSVVCRSNKHMRESRKHRRSSEHFKSQAQRLQNEVQRLKERVMAKEEHANVLKKLLRQERAKSDELVKENRCLEREVGRWTLFWGWVKAHSRPGTLKWLERLWQRGPRRAPDGCWGAGQ